MTTILAAIESGHYDAPIPSQEADLAYQRFTQDVEEAYGIRQLPLPVLAHIHSMCDVSTSEDMREVLADALAAYAPVIRLVSLLQE